MTRRALCPARTLASSIAVLALVALSACNIVGPLVYFVKGPAQTPAVYTLDKSRPTVVFVDDQNSILPRRNLRTEIAAGATETIQAHKLVDDMIDGRSAIMAATRDRDSEPMSVVAIGRAVKAEVVIHVIVDSFSLASDGLSYSPKASVRVKVIDAKNDTRLWPPAQLEGGSPVNATLFEKTGDTPQGVGMTTKAQNELAHEMGVAVAELFFEHESRRPNRKEQ